MTTYDKSSVTILYGSDTGTAQDFAYLLLKRLRYLLLRPTIAALDEYPLKKLVTDCSFLIIVCATAGQGELPRNGKKFMKFLLKKKLPNDLLNHLHIATFGLGDSSYPKFNYAIKKLHTRLMQLGSNEICHRCEADEQTPEGLDGFYAEWELQLMQKLQQYFPGLLPLDDTTILRPLNTIQVDKLSPEVSSLDTKTVSITRTTFDNTLLHGKIISNQRVTSPDHFQDVRHLVIEGDYLNYKPGDAIGLFPHNDPDDVDALIQLQKHWVSIADKPLNIKGHIPYIEGGLIESKHLTLRTLLTHHLDLKTIPTRSFFFSLWHFIDGSTEDGAREKEKLQEFCIFENSEELYNYANRPRRLILETLLEFQNNLRIPVEHVFDLFPKIKPRLFSIASKPDPHKVELLIALVEYQTVIKRLRKGLCSSWIKTLAPGDKVVFSLHKQDLKFELPDTPKPPLILIGPGTGIAPMKSLVEYAADLNQDIYLIYGFRSEELDYLFKDLWEKLVAEKKMQLFLAISRSKTIKKQYVQNKVFEQAELIADLILNQKAILYVCGSSGSMPRQLRDTIVEVLSKHGLSEDDATKYIHTMESSGRYIQETW